MYSSGELLWLDKAMAVNVQGSLYSEDCSSSKPGSDFSESNGGWNVCTGMKNLPLLPAVSPRQEAPTWHLHIAPPAVRPSPNCSANCLPGKTDLLPLSVSVSSPTEAWM